MIEALISSGVTLIVCMLNNYFQQRSQQKKIDVQQQQMRDANKETVDMIDYKLSELTKRVDKHNNVVERTYKLEQAVAVTDEQIKVANHRINDLEKERE